jgi:hypothetical protein
MESIKEHERLIKPIKTDYKKINHILQDELFNFGSSTGWYEPKRWSRPYNSPSFYWLDEGDEIKEQKQIDRYQYNEQNVLSYTIEIIKTDYGIDDDYTKRYKLQMINDAYTNGKELEAKHEKLTTEIKCECGGTYRYGNKQRHFTNEIHMNFIKNGIVWIKPTEPYNPKEKIDCICGGKYILKHKSTHDKTTKHIEFMAKDENNDKKDEDDEDTKNNDDNEDDRFIIED